MKRALVALLLLFAVGSAWSQNATAGKVFYESPINGGKSCADGTCHGPNPAQNTRNIRKGAGQPAVILAAPDKVGEMTFLRGQINQQNANDLAAYILNPAAAVGSGLSASGNTLTFGTTQTSTTGSLTTPTSITITNTGASAVTITGIAKGGSNAAEFAPTGSCVGPAVNVPAGGSCTLGATFTPTTAGNRTATFTVQSGAAANPTITLIGTAASPTAPSLAFSLSSVTFNSQTVGTTSAARVLVITNNSLMPVSIAQISANPSPEFMVNGGCLITLAAGSTCTVEITFTPSAVGTRSGAATVTSSATGSPHTIALTGPGVSSPTGAATLAASAISFPSTKIAAASTPLQTTLTNTGNAVLTITSVTIAGPNASDFKLGAGTTCTAGALEIDASCMIQADFRPMSSGSKSAEVVIAHSAGQTAVALGGTAPAESASAASTASAAGGRLAPSNLGGGGALQPSYFLLLLFPALLLRRARCGAIVR